MPKLRVPPDEKRKRAVVAAIKYGKKMEDVSDVALATAAHIGIATLYERFKDPDQFRVCELRGISAKLHIPISELLGEQRT